MFIKLLRKFLDVPILDVIMFRGPSVDHSYLVRVDMGVNGHDIIFIQCCT